MSKICPSCNAQIADDAKFCNNCGKPQPAPNTGNAGQSQQSGQNQYSYSTPPPASGSQHAANEVFTADDIEKNKVVAGLAYFIFFLPLLAAPDSAFGKFHANQGLLLLIAFIINGIITGIPLLGWIVGPILYIVLVIFAIMGLVNGLNGKARELPIFGHLRILR